METRPDGDTVLRRVRITCPLCRTPIRVDVHMDGSLRADDPRRHRVTHLTLSPPHDC